MGFASYWEELRWVRGRLADNLEKVSRDIVHAEKQARPETSSVDWSTQFARLKSIRRQCEALLGEIDDMLELATNPEVDIVHELTELRHQYNRLEQDNDKLKKAVLVLRKKLRKEKKRRKQAEKSFRDLDRKIAEDPDALARAIDAYTDEERIRIHKFDEL